MGFQILQSVGKRVTFVGFAVQNCGRGIKEVLERRIDEASKYVPRERQALSPQRGFASVAGGNELSEDVQMRKLGLVVEVARDVWGEV